MKKHFLSKIYIFLFIASLPASFLFWAFFSDIGGFSEENEIKIAEIINSEFKNGDVILPVPEWDIGFTRHLRDGIIDISYTFSDYSTEELGLLTGGNESNLFIITDSLSTWEKVKNNHGLTSFILLEAGSARIAKIKGSIRNEKKNLDFVQDISSAEKVFLTYNGTVTRECAFETDRWTCFDNPWSYVGPMRTLMSGKWAKANWAHPRSMEILHIQFPNRENATHITLGTAFLSRGYFAGGDSVFVDVLADGKSIIKYENKAEKKTYTERKTLPAGTKTVDITFFVRNDGGRHFVFNGYLSKTQ